MLIERILYILWTNSLGLAGLSILIAGLERIRLVRPSTASWLWLSILLGYLAPFLTPVSRPALADSSRADFASEYLLVFLVWGLGAVAVSTFVLVREFRVRTGLRDQRLPSFELLRVLNEEAAEFGIIRPPRLLLAANLTAPILIGLRNPSLHLPLQGHASFNPEIARLWIAHELAHYRRRDSIRVRLVAMTAVLFWWNPFVWWALDRHRKTMELACDDAVVRGQADRGHAYAHALLALAERATATQVSSLNVRLSSAGRELAQRLERAMNASASRTGSPALSALGLISFALCGSFNVPGVKGLRFHLVRESTTASEITPDSDSSLSMPRGYDSLSPRS